MPPINVISLIRTPERRQQFRRDNPDLAFEFFDAVDGATLSGRALLATGLFKPGLPYTMGACGLALSHLALWDEIIANGEPRTIAEDDAIFRHDFADAHQKVLDAVPGWDVVLWGWNFNSVLSLNTMPGISPSVMFFDQELLRAGIGRFQASTETPRPLRLDKCFGTPCYSMSPAGAARFKAGCFPLTDFVLHYPVVNEKVRNFGIDTAMSGVYAAAQAYACFPPLVVSRNDDSVSTVQNKTYFTG